MKKLYFIAIYPPRQIIDEIKIFKQDLALNYDNSKALKNDAHITLFPPFNRETEFEKDIHTAFEKIDTHISPFEVTLNGFGSFPHSKHPVLYIKPEQNNHLNELYHRVQREFNFINYSFNPHITVGYRNLTFENYWKAWQIYKDKHYKTNFLVDEISLLRHDENWKIMARKNLSLSQ